ncbi:MAG TPA: sodium:alanine symporter family protein [Ruminococcaceae bacterium]|nr:sodium:alanine symporter family protein [Oscillospiraceae bacterium]
MLKWLEQANEIVNQVVWGPITLFLFLAVGIWFTMGTGRFQLSKIKLIFQNTLGSLGKNRIRKGNGISPFQAMSTALAGTMGVGNITGIATAMTLGGAGSIFWMWISAFFGMMTKYAEVLLAVRYRQKGISGYFGGPMYYMEKGVGSRVLAVIFSILCIAASFGVGNMTQSNAISLAANQLWSFPDWFSGLLTALAIGLVIIGGIRRIAAVAELMIPFLSLGYLVCSILVLILRAERLPDAFRMIFTCACTPRAAVGGAAGYTVSQAIRFGFARGIFSNEAGLGSAPIAHAAADASHPAAQGMWGIFEVFFDAVVVCTATALVVLLSGAIDLETGQSAAGINDAILVSETFAGIFGRGGEWFVTIAITIFAFTTVIGWSQYGAKVTEDLFGEKSVKFYRLIFTVAVIFGAVLEPSLAWDLSDTFNGLMMIPNLIGILALTPLVIRITRNYTDRRIYHMSIDPMLSYDPYLQEDFAEKMKTGEKNGKEE